MKYLSWQGIFVIVCLAVCGTSVKAELVFNGGFDSGLDGWRIATGGVGQTTITASATGGQPGGAAFLDRVTATAFDNKDILYQILPVVRGTEYRFDADWSGNLYNGGTGRNWAEAIIFFTNSGNPITDGTLFLDSDIQYKIASEGGPNDPPTTGFGWQSVLAAPNSATSPADGVFTATDDFMVVGFNLGGRDSTRGAAAGFYFVDNVSVIAVPEPVGISLAVLLLGSAVAYRRRPHLASSSSI